MFVHFIDTSVFTNIINVPGRNQQHDAVMKELQELLGHKDKNALVLPFATIIETGNHIAHCGDGNQRRRAAEKFAECIWIVQYMVENSLGRLAWIRWDWMRCRGSCEG